MALTFAKPPINEVVIGQRFSQRPDFLVPHFGQFWMQLIDDYPAVSHMPPLVEAEREPVVDLSSGSVLPRIWFSSSDETRLVQIQQDRLYFNWRQTEAVKPAYPRFPAIRAEFDRVFGIFSTYVERELGTPLSLGLLDMSYINVINYEDVDVESPKDFGRVLRDFAWRDEQRALPPPRSVGQRHEYDIDEATRLIITSGSASRVSDGSKVLRIELTAREMQLGLKPRDQWIADAHEAIVSGFKDVTTAEMHDECWQLIRE